MSDRAPFSLPNPLTHLRSRAGRWLARHGFRAVAPIGAGTWNAEYASGRWAHLGQLPELARFSVLAGYLRHFAPGGAILDVGCGEGVLLQRLRPDDYRRYLGVDLSSVALDAAAARGAPNAAWAAADAEVYVPFEQFDAMVFSEVLYYLADPTAVVERCAKGLNSGGVLLVSVSAAHERSAAIIEALKRRYRLLDQTRVAHGDDAWSWVCAVFAGGR